MLKLKSKNIDKAVFEELFNEHFDSVCNFIYYKSGDIEFAEDIAMDAFTKLWEKKPKIDPERIRSYLFTIANNLFVNQFNRQKVVLKFQNSLDNDMKAESPEFILEMKEFDKRLQKAVSELPEKNRIVFLLNRIDKNTYNEIADLLGITVKAIEKRMQKALDELELKLNKRL